MRIAWIIGGIPAGGVSTVCIAAAAAVAGATDHQVSLVVLHTCEHDFVPADGVELHTLRLPLDPLLTCKAFDQWLRRNQQDVLLFNDVSMLEPYLPYVPAEAATIVVVHDDGIRYLKPLVDSHRSVDFIVTVAAFIEALVRRAIPARVDRIRTIHNGGTFPEAMPRPRRSGEIRLLFMGRHDAFLKGLSDVPSILRSTAKRGAEVSLTIIGAQDATVKRRISKLAPKVRVTWLGRLTHDACQYQAGLHDVLLMTSRGEPFGMVTIEAMAMGCVPIAYDVESGTREILERDVSGFLVPLGDYEAIGDRITTLDRDRALLCRMANASIARARSAFSAARMGSQYADLVDNIAEIRTHRRVERLPFAGFVMGDQRKSFYRRLPAKWRRVIRRWVGQRPKIAYALRRYR